MTKRIKSKTWRIGCPQGTVKVSNIFLGLNNATACVGLCVCPDLSTLANLEALHK